MATVEERLSHLEGLMQHQWQGYSELRDDIRNLQQRVDTRLDGLEQRFDGRFQHLEQRFDARFDVLDRRQMTTLVAIVSGFAAVIGALLAR